jgi:DNA-binding NarL/FixJ family response regulator
MSTPKKSKPTEKSIVGGLATAIKTILAICEYLPVAKILEVLASLVEQATKNAVVRLRKEGKSIKEIARTVHIDDTKVSDILKAESGKSCKGKCACKCKDKKTEKFKVVKSCKK